MTSVDNRTRSTRSRLRPKVLLSVLISAGLTFGLASPASASAIHTYQPSNCQIKITGFEHWGSAAASTRDNNAACWEIQARLRYKDQNNNFNWVTGAVETDSYTRVVAGINTDWDKANGRSPNLSLTWWGYSR